MTDSSPLYDPMTEPPDEPPEDPTPQVGSRDAISPWLIAAILLLLIGSSTAAWWWLRGRDLPASESDNVTETPAAAATAPTPAAESETEPEPRPPLPPLDESDSRVRGDASQLSSRAEWVDWLAPQDLVRRFVAGVANVSNGESPRVHARHLAPRSPFLARSAGDDLVIDPASYQRYDLAADVVSSVDIGAAVALFHDLEPLFEAAYAEIGDPRRTFRDTLAQAIDQVLAVEVPDGPIELEPHATTYRFADPDLEALSPAAKHLLRLGPENAKKVQTKLGFFRDALDLSTTAEAPSIPETTP